MCFTGELNYSNNLKKQQIVEEQQTQNKLSDINIYCNVFNTPENQIPKVFKGCYIELYICCCFRDIVFKKENR